MGFLPLKKCVRKVALEIIQRQRVARLGQYTASCKGRGRRFATVGDNAPCCCFISTMCANNDAADILPLSFHDNVQQFALSLL